MPHESFEFDFDFDYDEASYDPLADTSEDDELVGEGAQQQFADSVEATDDQLELSAAQVEQEASEQAAPVDTRTPVERIDSLFNEMDARRHILMGMLGFLQSPRMTDELATEVDRMQKYDSSVYTSSDYARALEKCGAIKKVNPDGTDFDVNVDQEPEIVEIDGVEYYKPADGRKILWLITEAGQAYYDADKPLDRLRELLAKDPIYLPIYKRILVFCSEEGGHSIAEISSRVDDDPLVQDPRLYASSFVRNLEKCNAVCWEDDWKTTEIGAQGLEAIAALSEAETEDELADEGRE